MEKTEAEEGMSPISTDEKAVTEELNGEASVSDSREENCLQLRLIIQKIN